MNKTRISRKIKLSTALFAVILLMQMLVPSGARAAGDTSMNIAGDSVEAEAGGSVSIPIRVFKSQKKSSTVTLKAKTATYTGKKIAIGKATVTGSSGKVTYKYYSDSACKKTVKAANVINAGTYYVKATVAADTDYMSATSKKVKLVIKKATQKIKSVRTSLSAKKNLNKSQTFTLGGSAKGKLTFNLSSAGGSGIKVSSAGKVTVPKQMKKGTYRIKVVVQAKATANYSAAQTTKTIIIRVK